jgi:hypothetical protein
MSTAKESAAPACGCDEPIRFGDVPLGEKPLEDREGVSDLLEYEARFNRRTCDRDPVICTCRKTRSTWSPRNSFARRGRGARKEPQR